MNQTLKSHWPLFFGLTMIMIGNGLQGTLIGVRATIEEFSPFTTGLIMSSYYFGFLIGSQVCQRLIKDVGHIRVFAALASMASTTVLVHVIFLDPWVWGAMRIITGFSYAGLYIVIESWLNDAADNKSRGRMMAIYMILCYLGMILGQLLLNIAAPEDIELFVLTSVLISLALLPISLSKRPAPEIRVPKHIKFMEIFKKSPIGVIGMSVSGMITGILFGIGAVYASKVGYTNVEISIFMSFIILGGTAFQIPIGMLSDWLDRRLVLTGVFLLISITAFLMSFIPPQDMVMSYIFIFIVGGLSLSIYSLALAHTNDHLEKEQIMSGSSTMVMVNGIGSSLSPMAVTYFMGLTGDSAFFISIATISACMFTFALFRMSTSEGLSQDDQGTYIITPVRSTSPMTSSMMKEQDAGTHE